jgi:hypothetical protein
MNPPANENWKGVTWDDAELETLRVGASLTLREKLQWLEEADHLAETLRHARIRYSDPSQPGGWMIAEGRPATDQANPPPNPIDRLRKLHPDV